MRHSVLALTTLVTTFAIIDVGCGDGRPPVSDEPTLERDDRSVVEERDTLGPVICEPFSLRPCVQVYIDDNGTRVCQPTFHVCRSDGRRWTACGDLDGGASAPPTSDEDAAADAGEDDRAKGPWGKGAEPKNAHANDDPR